MEFMIPIVAIVFGTTFAGFIFYQIFSLIKTWINRNNSAYNEEAFERMAKAFIKHKKDTERRLQNIEAIVTEEEPLVSEKELQKTTTHQIEIDSQTEEDYHTSEGNQNLRNMLKE